MWFGYPQEQLFFKTLFLVLFSSEQTTTWHPQLLIQTGTEFIHKGAEKQAQIE